MPHVIMRHGVFCWISSHLYPGSEVNWAPWEDILISQVCCQHVDTHASGRNTPVKKVVGQVIHELIISKLDLVLQISNEYVFCETVIYT